MKPVCVVNGKRVCIIYLPDKRKIIMKSQVTWPEKTFSILASCY